MVVISVEVKVDVKIIKHDQQEGKNCCGGKVSKIVRDGQRNGVDEQLDFKLESSTTTMMIVHITF